MSVDIVLLLCFILPLTHYDTANCLFDTITSALPSYQVNYTFSCITELGKMDLIIQTVPLIHELCLLTCCLFDQTFHRQTEIRNSAIFYVLWGVIHILKKSWPNTWQATHISLFVVENSKKPSPQRCPNKKEAGELTGVWRTLLAIVCLCSVLKINPHYVSLMVESAAFPTQTCPNSSFSFSLCNNTKVFAS